MGRKHLKLSTESGLAETGKIGEMRKNIRHFEKERLGKWKTETNTILSSLWVINQEEIKSGYSNINYIIKKNSDYKNSQVIEW